MQGPIKAGRPLRGLGEDMGDPRRAVVEPSTDDLMRAGLPPDAALRDGLLEVADPTTRALNERLRSNDLASYYGLTPVLSVPMPAAQVVITNRYVGLTPIRVDTAPEKRTYIHFANMSDNDIWIHTTTNVRAGTIGYPLAPNSVPGAYNGATFGIDASVAVRWYAVADAGASNLLLVVETSRK